MITLTLTLEVVSGLRHSIALLVSMTIHRKEDHVLFTKANIYRTCSLFVSPKKENVRFPLPTVHMSLILLGLLCLRLSANPKSKVQATFVHSLLATEKTQYAEDCCICRILSGQSCSSPFFSHEKTCYCPSVTGCSKHRVPIKS